MPSSIGQIINQYLFGVPMTPLKVVNGAIEHMQWTNFLKILAAYTCSYSSGSFTGTLVGASGVTGTFQYRIIGNMAYITVPSNITAASGSNNFSITGIPTVLVTATSMVITGVAAEDNSAFSINTNLSTGTANTWTLGNQLTGGTTGWSTVGTKGILAQTFSFPLDA